MAISATKKHVLNNMNASSKKAGLGDILNTMAYSVVAAGEFTTVGGDATESITASGVTSSDISIVTVNTAGATPRTVTTSNCGTDAITVVLSGDPSTDHVLNYVVVRATT